MRKIVIGLSICVLLAGCSSGGGGAAGGGGLEEEVKQSLRDLRGVVDQYASDNPGDLRFTGFTFPESQIAGVGYGLDDRLCISASVSPLETAYSIDKAGSMYDDSADCGVSTYGS